MDPTEHRRAGCSIRATEPFDPPHIFSDWAKSGHQRFDRAIMLAALAVLIDDDRALALANAYITRPTKRVIDRCRRMEARMVEKYRDSVLMAWGLHMTDMAVERDSIRVRCTIESMNPPVLRVGFKKERIIPWI